MGVVVHRRTPSPFLLLRNACSISLSSTLTVVITIQVSKALPLVIRKPCERVRRKEDDMARGRTGIGQLKPAGWGVCVWVGGGVVLASASGPLPNRILSAGLPAVTYHDSYSPQDRQVRAHERKLGF